MSTCERCHAHDCKCCAHKKPPGECVECANEENEALCERVDELEERVAVLETHIRARQRVDRMLADRITALEKKSR
jgi:hypothetical protein